MRFLEGADLRLDVSPATSPVKDNVSRDFFRWEAPCPKMEMESTHEAGHVRYESWDDGHPLDVRVAYLLAKYGLRGTFYIPGGAEHGTMTVNQIRGALAFRSRRAHPRSRRSDSGNPGPGPTTNHRLQNLARRHDRRGLSFVLLPRGGFLPDI